MEQDVKKTEESIKGAFGKNMFFELLYQYCKMWDRLFSYAAEYENTKEKKKVKLEIFEKLPDEVKKGLLQMLQML